MKYLLYISVLWFWANNIYAQNFQSCIPKAGDKYFRCQHEGDTELFLLDQSAPGYWDFSFLKTYFSIKETFYKKEVGKYGQKFKKANLVLLKSNGEEEYYQTTPSQLMLEGEVINASWLKNNRQVINYKPAKRVISLPYSKGQVKNQTYNAVILLAKKDISLPFFNEEFDSLQINIKITESLKMRDDGLISISKDSNPAIELISSVSTGVTFYIKDKNNKKWELNTKLNADELPREIKNKFWTEKHEKIEYLNPSFKGIYLSYRIKDKNVKEVDFQDLDLDPSSLNITHAEQGVIAQPNPSFGPIRFQLFNHEPGDYKLEIYNVVGKPIYTKKFSKTEGNLLEADLSSLRRGTYIYSIVDNSGRKIATKRISLISI